MIVTFEHEYLLKMYEDGKCIDKKHRYQPDILANDVHPSRPIHPGEMIRDELEYRGISQKSLADGIGIPPSVLNAVLKGKRSVTTEYALLLEAALGIEADLWLGLQSEYNKQVAKSDPSFLERLARIRHIASVL